MRIALSGMSGSGKTTAVTRVAEALGLACVNYTFREMARERGISFDELRQKAERDFPNVDLDLDSRQIELVLAEKDCIVGSRLAAWLDTPGVLKRLDLAKDAFAFDCKFWLDAPLEVRAERIAEREGRAFKEVLAETRERDALDSARYARIYGVDLRKPRVDARIDAAALDAAGVAREIVRLARK
ncbi:MAG: cytidylate kinase family protein [Candidatus Micrarchaeia archaeon]